ncbi:MAG TPA: hypothetical protein VHM19_14245, partial [Polyangiales bacterium]|nr:hypothetical protein [Polyangiales bacterium]
MRGAWVVVVLLACGALGCSRDVATGRRSGSEPGDKGGGAAGAGFGNAGKAGSGSGVGDTEGALRVHVEDAQRMTLEVLTLACAGDCADIEAVAHGGNPPYTFAWEDGSTHAKRRVCLDAAKTLSVSASDSAVTTAEFVHDAQTVVAEVSAAVLDCGDGGTPIIPGELCVPNASFEGTPGVNGSADGAPGGIPGQMHIAFEADPWQECETSPDIWDEKQSWGGTPGAPVATDGATYLALYDVLGKRESAGAALCAPLIAGHTYSFQVDTAFRTQGSFT